MLLLPARSSNVGRIFSFGGGVQSTAVLVMQATGQLWRPYDAFVFANVGTDSENPATLEYVERIAKPYAEAFGIKLIEVRKTMADGSVETLAGRIYRTAQSITIPAYMGGNGSPGKRACTMDFKIRVMDRWSDQQGYTHVIQGMGISTDEIYRMRDQQWYTEKGQSFQKRREYPLIEQRIRREDCRSIIESAGLPIPPKSSCFFCPFTHHGEWLEMRRLHPDLFQKAVDLERHINSKRGAEGTERVFLHRALVPLDQAVGQQLNLFPEYEMDTCESGYCMV